jgi:hypothetical protein
MTTTTVLDYLLSFTSNLPPEKTVLPLLSLHTPENFTCAPGRLGPLKINQAREPFEFFLKKITQRSRWLFQLRENFFKKHSNNK